MAVDVNSGESVRYTSRRASDVALDGADQSNTPGGATPWCTEAEFGAAGCPTGLATVTAFRILRTASVGVGETVEHEVAVVTSGQQDGDRYTNRFGLRASNLALPVQSNPATITVVAGAVGDRVWSDENRDGVQDRGEPGIATVPVRLTGEDDRGHEVVAETATDDDGEYHFDGLRPGTYRVHWTAPEGREFAEELVGGDHGNDSDADDNGSTGTITIAALRSDEGRLAGVERNDTVDAGIMPVAVTPIVPPVDPVDPVEPVSPVSPEDQGQVIDPTHPGTSVTSGSGTTADRPGTYERTSADRLAFTGAESVGVLVAAAALLLVSGGFLLVRRRARRTDRR
jgi:LPXTG-motif cell wall-anchored protein